VLRHAAWPDSWWSAALLGAVLGAAAWPLGRQTTAKDNNGAERGTGAAGRRWFTWLLLAYTLEGVGYIIAGTFLVAAIDQTASTTLGSSAWIIVGAAAVPSAALWAGFSRLWSRPALLAVALGAQAAGIALPALVGGTAAALASAVLFGATFLGVATLALAIGAHLRAPRAVAILTTGYSVGQLAGPLLVTPVLHHSYQPALLAGAAIVAVAAVAALVLRRRFPHHLGPQPGPGGPMTDGDDDGIPGRHGDHGAGWHHRRGGWRDPEPGGGPRGGTGRARAPATAVASAAGSRPVADLGPVPGRRRDRTAERADVDAAARLAARHGDAADTAPQRPWYQPSLRPSGLSQSGLSQSGFS
jgi:hypothetical protein